MTIPRRTVVAGHIVCQVKQAQRFYRTIMCFGLTATGKISFAERVCSAHGRRVVEDGAFKPNGSSRCCPFMLELKYSVGLALNASTNYYWCSPESFWRGFYLVLVADMEPEIPWFGRLWTRLREYEFITRWAPIKTDFNCRWMTIMPKMAPIVRRYLRLKKRSWSSSSTMDFLSLRPCLLSLERNLDQKIFSKPWSLAMLQVLEAHLENFFHLWNGTRWNCSSFPQKSVICHSRIRNHSRIYVLMFIHFLLSLAHCLESEGWLRLLLSRTLKFFFGQTSTPTRPVHVKSNHLVEIHETFESFPMVVEPNFGKCSISLSKCQKNTNVAEAHGKLPGNWDWLKTCHLV